MAYVAKNKFKKIFCLLPFLVYSNEEKEQRNFSLQKLHITPKEGQRIYYLKCDVKKTKKVQLSTSFFE